MVLRRAGLGSLLAHAGILIGVAYGLAEWSARIPSEPAPVPSIVIEARIDAPSVETPPEVPLVVPVVEEPHLVEAMEEPQISEEAEGRVEAEPHPDAAPAPPYPRSARRMGIEGEVLLWVQVDAKGEVHELGIEQSSGHPILDRAALQTVAGWRFFPALQGEVPVTSRTTVRIQFKRD